MATRPNSSNFIVRDGERAVCRKYLARMAGLYEGDAIEETFGAPACEMDCEDCELHVAQSDANRKFLTALRSPEDLIRVLDIKVIEEKRKILRPHEYLGYKTLSDALMDSRYTPKQMHELLQLAAKEPGVSTSYALFRCPECHTMEAEPWW